jgi:predicted ribosome quality control (RQC) complex YloA/Tae2 family protein
MTMEMDIFMHAWSRFGISNISVKPKMRSNSRQAARREPRRAQRYIKLEKKTRGKEGALAAGIQDLMNISELLEQKINRAKESWKNLQRMGL